MLEKNLCRVRFKKSMVLNKKYDYHQQEILYNELYFKFLCSCFMLQKFIMLVLEALKSNYKIKSNQIFY